MAFARACRSCSFIARVLLGERFVERDDVLEPAVAAARQHLVNEGDSLEIAATLFAEACTRVVDEDATHRLRGDCEEVSAPTPFDSRLIDEPKVSLVDERGGLQGLTRALLPQIGSGQATKLLVDARKEVRRRRRPVAALE
jgi:hypothetical protein